MMARMEPPVYCGRRLGVTVSTVLEVIAALVFGEQQVEVCSA
jgi:hypothetical protein